MAAHKIFIRMQKEEAAFIHHVLEAHEGWAAYSTLPFGPKDPYRDLVLMVPEDWLIPVNDLLESLKDRLIILPKEPSIR